MIALECLISRLLDSLKIDKPADEIPFPTSRIRSFPRSLEIAEQIAARG